MSINWTIKALVFTIFGIAAVVAWAVTDRCFKPKKAPHWLVIAVVLTAGAVEYYLTAKIVAWEWSYVDHVYEQHGYNPVFTASNQESRRSAQ